MPETLEQRGDRVDRDLSAVAKILAGAFVAIAGVGTAFGLSQDALLVAVNNQVWLYILVAIFSLAAISLSIWSLFQGNDRRGNRKQSWILGIGVGFYLSALLLAIWGVADAATGNGRPNITDVSVEPDSVIKVSFTVHADGVQKGKMIIVEVDGFKDKVPLENDPLYRALLHADDKGHVEQKVHFILPQGGATRLTIRARPDHEDKDGMDCDASQAPTKLGCATVLLRQ